MSTYEILSDAPVAPVIEAWLQQEIEESDSGPNKYLSDFPTLVSHFYLPFEDQGNFQSQKTRSHQNRIINWLKAYKEEPRSRTDDFFTAKIGFNTLMTIGGSFRKQCMLVSPDGASYMRMRHEQGPVGIDLAGQVASELATNVPEIDSLDPESRIDYIVDRTLHDVDENVRLHRSLHEWAIKNRKPSGQPLAEPDAEPVLAMLEAQRIMVGLEVAQMAVAATFRENDPRNIPFLHPMNISGNPGVIYPLAA